MSIQSASREIRTDASGRVFDAYVAVPAQAGPAVIVVGSIFGVTEGLRDACDGLARDGFLAVAPDLFWRTEPGPLAREPEQRARAFARYEAFDITLGVADLADAIAFARAQPEHRGGVAVLGYCFGGLFAFLGVTRLDADAGIAFHGTRIGEHLAEASHVRAPLSLHFGEADDSVPMTEVAAIQAALRAIPNVEIFTYPDAKHGFTQSDGPSFHAPAAIPAMERAMRLLETLRTADSLT